MKIKKNWLFIFGQNLVQPLSLLSLVSKKIKKCNNLIRHYCESQKALLPHFETRPVKPVRTESQQRTQFESLMAVNTQACGTSRSPLIKVRVIMISYDHEALTNQEKWPDARQTPIDGVCVRWQLDRRMIDAGWAPAATPVGARSTSDRQPTNSRSKLRQTPINELIDTRRPRRAILHRIITVLWTSLAHENIVITLVIKLWAIMT